MNTLFFKGIAATVFYPLAYVLCRINYISFTEAIHAYILLNYTNQSLPFLHLKRQKLFVFFFFN